MLKNALRSITRCYMDVQLRPERNPAAETKLLPTANIQSYGCEAESCQAVHLMTAVGEVHGAQLKARVRIFIDPGSQASFVSSALVTAVKPRRVGQSHVRIRAFDSPSVDSSLDVYEIGLTNSKAERLSIRVDEKPCLNLAIKPLSSLLIRKWREFWSRVERLSAVRYTSRNPHVAWS